MATITTRLTTRPGAGRRWSRLLLPALLLFTAAGAQTVPPAVAVVATARPAAPVVYVDVAGRLRSPEVRAAFAHYNATHGKQIQGALHDIYQHDPAYQKDYAGGRAPLSDKVVGPVTLKWIEKFCEQYNILASAPDFADQVTDALMQVAAIQREHPDWQKILLSADFADWINRQPSARQTEIYKIRSFGAAAQINALIQLYQQRAPAASAAAAPTRDGVNISFRLSVTDIKDHDDRLGMLKQLKVLVGRSFNDLFEFDAALRTVLKGPPEMVAGLLPQVEESARSSRFLVDAGALSRLKGAHLPDEILEQMGKLQESEYITKEDLQRAIAAGLQSPGMKDKLDQFEARIGQETQRSRYEITAAVFDALQENKVPPVLFEMVKDMLGVDYPTEALLDSGIRGRIHGAIWACRGSQFQQQPPISDEWFARLPEIGGVKAELMAELAPIRKPGLTCTAAKIEKAGASIDRLVELALPLLKQKTRVVHPLPTAPDTSGGWATPWCACSLDTMAGKVYGFYPPWLKRGDRKINFSLLSRIGLYGLTFNRDGRLDPQQMQNALPVGLLSEAHKYGTEVDWVIYQSDWSAWPREQEQKKQVLATLEEGLLKLLGTPAGGVGAGATPYLTLGLDHVPSNGDGLVIYFDNFPDADKEIFNGFIKELYKKMRQQGGKKWLTIMASREDMAVNNPTSTTFSYKNLSDLMTQTNQIRDDKPLMERSNAEEHDLYVLALLEEPVAHTKIVLRADAERTVHGSELERLLRGIIPVLEFNEILRPRLKDTLLYLNDNYAGVGFWPLQLTESGKEQGQFDQSLADEMVQSASPLQELPCLIACPYRTQFRIGMWVVMLSMLGFIGACVAWCDFRTRMAHGYYRLLIVVPFLWLIVGVVMLRCDLELREATKEYFPLIFALILVALGCAAYLYLRRRPQKP